MILAKDKIGTYFCSLDNYLKILKSIFIPVATYDLHILYIINIYQ